MIASCTIKIKDKGSKPLLYCDKSNSSSFKSWQEFQPCFLPKRTDIEIIDYPALYEISISYSLIISKTHFENLKSAQAKRLFNYLGDFQNAQFPMKLRGFTHCIEKHALKQNEDPESNTLITARHYGKPHKLRYSPFKPYGPWENIPNINQFEFIYKARMSLEKQLLKDETLKCLVRKIEPYIPRFLDPTGHERLKIVHQYSDISNFLS